MAVVMETGTWTASGSTPQTINLVDSSLTPMAIMVRCVRAQAAGAGFQASVSFAIGFGTRQGGVTQSGCTAFVMRDNLATGDCFRIRDTTLLSVLTQTANGTSDYTITLTAFAAGSFSVSYSSAANSSGDVYEYTVWGGLDDAIVLNKVLSGTGASEAETGAGFQPNCLLVFGTGLVTAASISQNMSFAFGCSTGPSNSWSMGFTATDADTCTSAMNWNRSFRTDACLELLATNLNSTFARYDLDSFDSDGFTLGILDVPETTTLVSTFLLMKAPDGSFEAGTKEKSASTGADTFTLTDSSLVVEGVLLGMANRIGSGLTLNGIDFCLGAGSTAHATRGSAVNNCSGAAAIETINTTADRYSATDNVIAEIAGGTSPAENCEAHFSAKGTGTFEINWSVNSGTTHTIGYLAVGNPAPQVSDVPGRGASARYHRASSIYRTEGHDQCLHDSI